MTTGQRRLIALGYPARATAVLLLALLALLLLGVPGAGAHATVVDTAPTNGSELDQPPTQIRVTFNEAVSLTGDDPAVVLAADGTRVDDGTVGLEADGTVLVIGIVPELAKGTYVASWYALSADSHPTGGSIQFGYLVPASTLSADEPVADPRWGLAVGWSKGLVYLGLVLALGLAPTVRLIHGRGIGPGLLRWVRAGAVLTLAASVAQWVSQYGWVSSGQAESWSWRGLAEFSRSAYGQTVVVRLALVLALLALTVVPRRGGVRSAGRLDLRWIAGAVIGLAVIATVVLKLALVTVALGLALSGWLWIRRSRREPESSPARTDRLRTRVTWEAGIGVAIVISSGVLSSTTPAQAAWAPQRHIASSVGPYALQIDVAPARPGPQTFRVRVTGADDRTAVPLELELDLEQSSAGVQGIPVDFVYRLPQAIRPPEATPVIFSSSAVAVPVEGQWVGTLTVVAGPTEQYTTTFSYQVQ